MSGATVHTYKDGLRYDTVVAGGTVGEAVSRGSNTSRAEKVFTQRSIRPRIHRGW